MSGTCGVYMNGYIDKLRQISMASHISSGEWRRRRRCLCWCWCWCWGAAALQILTTILLSLFLPLSFLLLARLHDFNGVGSESDGGDFFFAFIFQYVNSTILYLFLSFIALAAFVHSLTGGRVTLIQLLLSRNNQQQQNHDHGGGGGRGRPCLSVAWLLLCTSMMFAELGIEFQSPSPSSLPDYRRITSPTEWLFAVGLYETMMYWSESVVQAVVDDVVAVGCSSKEGEEIKGRRRWMVVERVGLGLSFGALWWWRLRDHVDSLSAAVEENDDDHVVLKVGDFLSLGLYYLTLFTGAIRAFTGMMQLIIRRWRRRSKTTIQPPPPVAAADVETV